MSDEQGFLQHLIDHPGDDAIRLIYADWLEEQGDSRSQYIRLEWELARMDWGDPDHGALEAEMQSCRRLLDPRWVNEVSRTYDLVLLGYEWAKKIAIIKTLRALTGCGLAEGKHLCEALPATIWQGVSRLQAENGREYFADDPAEMVIRLSKTVARLPSLMFCPEPGHALLLLAAKWVWDADEQIASAIQQTTGCAQVDAKSILQRQRPTTIRVYPTEAEAHRAAKAFSGIAVVEVWPADRFGRA